MSSSPSPPDVNQIADGPDVNCATPPEQVDGGHAIWIENAVGNASPRLPINEYIFPDDIYTNPGKFVSIFERFDKLCFVGHTHVPGVFLEGPDFFSPDELNGKYEITDERAIVNVGSVGQPRDRDLRSSFVLLSDTHVEFVRVMYDVDATVKKVEAIPELDDFLGTRLLDGR